MHVHCPFSGHYAIIEKEHKKKIQKTLKNSVEIETEISLLVVSYPIGYQIAGLQFNYCGFKQYRNNKV